MNTLKHLIVICCFSALPLYADDCREGYPAHWWEPVAREHAPSWEVLPQDAGPCEVVLSKRDKGGLELLSNFAVTPFQFEDGSYQSIEGFWQMMKYPEGDYDLRAQHPDANWPYSRAQVARMVGFDAKRAGNIASKNMKKMNINWVSYRGARMTYKTTEYGEHYHLIRSAMAAKLQQNPAVRRVLLQTGDLRLIADHHQGDQPPPAWRYAEIWMQLRQQIRAQAD